MKLLITGGGTGGHVYPGVAIADKFMKNNPENQVLFVGTEKGMESKIVPKAGYEIKYIKASGLNRKNLAKNVKFVSDYASGRRNAKKIIRDFNPDAVIGTGGYVSGPVMGAAISLNIPVFIQEQNATPGMANKSLEKKAEKVFLGFGKAGVHFKNKNKHVVSGNPIAARFEDLDEKKCREKFGYREDDFVILIFGGSLGAEKINNAALEIIKEFSGNDRIKIVMVTGRRFYNDVKSEVDKIESNREKVIVHEYVDNMEEHMGSANLVISRSGAITVSELAYLGKPCIFIPSPNVTGNHQYYNGEDMATNGPAVLIEEKDIDTLIYEVKNLVENTDFYLELIERGKRLKGINGAEIIVEVMKSFV